MGYLLESNSFYQKLSKNKSAFIFLVIVLISSLIANGLLNNYLVSEFIPDHNIEAIELDEKPTKFFPYIMLDPYGIKAIFNENSSVKISFIFFVEIDELIKSYDTRNVQYGDNYYRLHFDFVGDTGDTEIGVPFSIFLLSTVSALIFLISAILIIIIVFISIKKIFDRVGI